MRESDTTLPDFAKPPLIEVVLSVQFDRLVKLRSPQLGLLWAEFKEGFPETQEQPPLAPVIETFGLRPVQKIEVEFEMAQTPRVWFLDRTGSELIQVQQDRFIHNWRKIDEGQEYPRYEYIRAKFEKELSVFHNYLVREEIGNLVPNQCEVTYINHFESGAGWEKHSEIDKVLTVWTNSYSDTFLLEPEDIRFGLRYVISDDEGNPTGRLHMNLQPGYRVKDNKAILILNLTARGKPNGEGIEHILQFLDLGREWIVRGFTSITSQEMHKIWERRDKE